MKNEILISEEVNKMKYLFGYQRGVVISEQQTRATTTTTTAATSTSTENPDNADFAKIVTYYSANTDPNWSFVEKDTLDNGSVIYDRIEVKPKDTTTMGTDCEIGRAHV